MSAKSSTQKKEQKEHYDVFPQDTKLPTLPWPKLDKIVLKSSAYLTWPQDASHQVLLTKLLKDRCSAKKLNYLSKKVMYDPYYEHVKIKGRAMVKVPLLFPFLEGIPYKTLVDLRKVPETMPEHFKVKPEFELREHQKVVHPLAMKELSTFPCHATTICQVCGAGKTIQVCKLIAMLHVRTFIGVPNLDLVRQVKEELQLVMDIPSHQIQLVGSTFPEPQRNKWVYISVFNSAMTTSNYTTKYADIIAKADLLVVDECHKFPAKCVKSILKHFHGKYRIGLTATPERKDGLAHMIFKMLGIQCVMVKREIGDWAFTMLEYYNPKHKGDLTKTLFGKVNRDAIAMRRRVCDDQARTQAIADFVVRNLQKDVIVFADWKDMVHGLVKEIEVRKPRSTCTLIGGQSKAKAFLAQLEKDKQSKPYVVATIAKAGTGMNIARLNDVVYASDRTPDALLEQSSGRALRRKRKKRAFYVKDVATPYLAKRADACQAWFKKHGYKIQKTITIGKLGIPGSIRQYMTHEKRKGDESVVKLVKRKVARR